MSKQTQFITFSRIYCVHNISISMLSCIYCVPNISVRHLTNLLPICVHRYCFTWLTIYCYLSPHWSIVLLDTIQQLVSTLLWYVQFTHYSSQPNEQFAILSLIFFYIFTLPWLKHYLTHSVHSDHDHSFHSDHGHSVEDIYRLFPTLLAPKFLILALP